MTIVQIVLTSSLLLASGALLFAYVTKRSMRTIRPLSLAVAIFAILKTAYIIYTEYM